MGTIAENMKIALRIVDEYGVPRRLMGHRYLAMAAAYTASLTEKERMGHVMTKQIYPYVAEHADTTTARAERAIRHAIEVAWDCGDADSEFRRKLLPVVSVRRGKPVNADVIYDIAYRILDELEAQEL